MGLTFEGFEHGLIVGRTEGAPTTIVDDCAFLDNSDYGMWGPSLGVLEVTNSLFAGNPSGIVWEYPPESLRVENTVFIDNEDYAVDRWQGDYGMSSCPDFELHHNTVLGSRIAFAASDVDSDCDPSTDPPTFNLTNNIFVGVEWPWAVGDYWDIGTISHNLVATDVTDPDGGIDEDVTGITVTDNLVADPVFVDWTDDGDWTNDDLRLMAGSPGIDLGITGYATSTTDHDGDTRSEDGDADGTAAPDAGAWELDPDEDDDGHAMLDAGGDDCDDTDAAVHPGADESCNGLDDDCDGDTDGADAIDAATWYADTDADGWGDPATATPACDAPAGWLATAGDCDDGDATAFPDAIETCGDGVDQDCDGSDLACQDTGDTGDTGEGDTGDSEPADDSANDEPPADEPPPCGCGTPGGGPAGFALAMALLGARRREHRA